MAYGITSDGFKRLAQVSKRRSAKKMVVPQHDLIEELFNWHGGQGDPVYAVASSWYAGKSVPYDIVEDAISSLESVYSRDDDESLGSLIDMLSYALKDSDNIEGEDEEEEEKEPYGYYGE